MPADGASLLEAAIRGAVLAHAPRRTVQAVAAAVTGVLLRQTTAAALNSDSRRQPDAPMETDEVGDPAQLLASLRASRRSQRQKKKERRRLAKQAAELQSSSPLPHSDQHTADAKNDDGAAGQRAEVEGLTAAAPALAPAGPALPPTESEGLATQLAPAPAALSAASSATSLAPTLRPADNASVAASLPSISAVDSVHASGTASAGRPRPGRSRSNPKTRTQEKPRQK